MADMRDQLGFLGAFVASSLGRNERLDRIAGAVKWYRFEKLLKKLVPAPEGAGRPPYEALVMFKALLLAQLYDLSDAGLEEAVNDRVSFRRFLGLPLEASAPDHTTYCRFRNRLSEGGLIEKLFGEFDKQLEHSGLMLKRGTMVDATLVEAAAARPSGDSECTDPDARFAKKDGKSGSVHGYKAHIAVDQGSELIRAALMTPANVNETTVADRLIRFDEQAVYADKAYAKAERRDRLKAAAIKDRIMHKSWGGGPKLSHWQTLHNKLITPIRSRVETVFAIFKKHMRYRRVRYIGLLKNQTQLLLLALAYNMRRAAVLRATPP
jgi:IS5 family transposase